MQNQPQTESTAQRIRETIDRDGVAALARQPAGPCVSLYMPTHRAGAEIQQDPIRLKNLLADAHTQLTEAGMRGPVATKLLAPLQALIAHSKFWQHQSDGLALFRAADEFHIFCLPRSFAAEVVIGAHYFLKPLLPLLSGDGSFFILALSQNQVRLLQASRDQVQPMQTTGIPGSLAEALPYDDPERQLQVHSSTGQKGAAPGQSGIFHGHGAGQEAAKDLLVRYFSQVDRGVTALLAGRSAPLVLAAVDYLHPIYAEVNSYPHLTETGIMGNPEELSEQALHQRGWQIIQPIFQRTQAEATATYHQLAGTGRTATQLAEILPAAHHGRIHTLFVALGERQWGRYDPATGKSSLSTSSAGGEERDLLDLAAAQTILTGGTVFALPPEQMPKDTEAIAALLRY